MENSKKVDTFSWDCTNLTDMIALTSPKIVFSDMLTTTTGQASPTDLNKLLFNQTLILSISKLAKEKLTVIIA